MLNLPAYLIRWLTAAVSPQYTKSTALKTFELCLLYRRTKSFLFVLVASKLAFLVPIGMLKPLYFSRFFAL